MRGVAQWYLCAGVCKALASIPSTAKVHQDKRSQFYRQLSTQQISGPGITLRLPDLPLQLTEHLSMAGAQGQRPWPFPDCSDPGTYESSRLRPLGKVSLPVTGPTIGRSRLSFWQKRHWVCSHPRVEQMFCEITKGPLFDLVTVTASRLH